MSKHHYLMLALIFAVAYIAGARYPSYARKFGLA